MFDVRRLIAGLGPRRPVGAYHTAVIALERGEFSVAVAGLDAVLAAPATPAERVRAHNKRGIAHLCLGDREGAVADFVAALELDPRFAPTVVNVGNVLLEDGHIDEAIVHFEAAIRYDERYPVAHLNLGVALKRVGRRSEAVRHLRLATRLEQRSFVRQALNPRARPAD